MLQHNPVIARIRSSVATRILTDLEKLAKDDPVGYAGFWHQFGAVLKEGLYDAVEHRAQLYKVCKFYSTHGDGAELIGLDDYIARMKPEQEHIYYISGESVETLKNSPQLEGFRARGLEVLLLTDTVDDFWLQQVHDYEGKPFKSITKGSIDLSKFKRDDADKPVETDSVKKLIATLKDILKDDVADVRLSDRLTDSPVCLVAGEKDVDMNMERVLKIHQKYESNAKRILEINGTHRLIERLAAYDGDMKGVAHLLLDQARIIQGDPLPDPTAFARRMAAIMEKGL
jgi:molecular chaperone HtpG